MLNHKLKTTLLSAFILLGSVWGLSAQEEGSATNQEGTPVAEEDRKDEKAKVEFYLGGLYSYNRTRMKEFYADYFGWYPQILMDLGVNLPSGLEAASLKVSNIPVGKYDYGVFSFIFGGGVRVEDYNRDTNGTYAEFSQGVGFYDEDFWTEQDIKRLAGKPYVENTYDVAYAHFGLEYYQTITAPKSPNSHMGFNFGFNSRFTKWLQDNNPLTTQLLFDSDLPDRDMSVVNKLYGSFSYAYTTYPEVKFNHGLYNEVGIKASLELAPGFMNKSITGEEEQMRDEWGRLLFWYRDETLGLDLWTTDQIASHNSFGNGASTLNPKPVMERRTTADYYKLDLSVWGRRTLWDIAPEYKSNVFSGYITSTAYLSWFDIMGKDGYIPLTVRGQYNRKFNTGVNINLTMNLPHLTVRDLKGWSTPKANADFAQIEDAIFGFLNKLGMNYGRGQFNSLAIVKPTFELWSNIGFSQEFDASYDNYFAMRNYALTDSDRRAPNFYTGVRLTIRLLDLLNIKLSYEFHLQKMGMTSDWAVFSL